MERYYYAYSSHPREGIDTFIAPDNALSADFRFVESMEGGYSGYLNMDNLELYTNAAIPEPATMVLFGISSAAMAFARRKKKSA
jgi:hypothetical protein